MSIERIQFVAANSKQLKDHMPSLTNSQNVTSSKFKDGARKISTQHLNGQHVRSIDGHRLTPSVSELKRAAHSRKNKSTEPHDLDVETRSHGS